MGTQSLIFFLKKYCLQESSQDILVPPLWERRENLFDFLFPISHGCARCNLAFFLVVNYQHADKYELDVDFDVAHSQPAWCRARSSSVHDGLEDIRWIYQVYGARAFADGVLRSSPELEIKIIFRHARRIDKFCHLFSAHQRPIVFLSYTWPAPATYHRPLCEDGDPRVGWSP